jgi:beta-lactamase class A
VDGAAAVPGSGVLTWLGPGLELSLADLAYLMVAVSDNTASNLLLDAVGFDRVQGTIASLGLVGTALKRRFLGRAPAAGEPENLTTAADLARLLAAIADDSAASPAGCARMRELLALQQDRARLARRLPAGVAFGGKSGSLPGLVHDAGLLTGPADVLAVAVLTRGFPDPYAAEEAIGEVALAMLEEVEA